MRMRLEYDVLALTTRHAFTISRQAAPAVRRNVRVRLIADDGVEGWGEAAPTPFYGESTEGVCAALDRVRAGLPEVSADPAELEAVEAWVASVARESRAAQVAVSAALHDLAGRRLGVPVWRLLGHSPRAPLSSFTIGIDEPEVMREKVREAAGYPILKVKLGTDRDDAILALIREEAPGKPIRVDANTGWTADSAIAILPMLHERGVDLIEQPLPKGDLEGTARLRREAARIGIPIVADESCERAVDVPALAGAFDAVNVKLAKCGSLREALRVIHTARAHGMGVMLGCMVETTLGVAAAVQLAPLVDYVDLDGAALLADDPFRGPGLEADGTLRFNEEPGLGVSAR